MEVVVELFKHYFLPIHRNPPQDKNKTNKKTKNNKKTQNYTVSQLLSLSLSLMFVCPPHEPNWCFCIALVNISCVQTFLTIRRIRLIEDLMLLTLSVGKEKEEKEEEGRGQQRTDFDEPNNKIRLLSQAPPPAAGPLSSLEGLRRELAVARSKMLPHNGGGDGGGGAYGASSINTTSLHQPSTTSPALGSSEASRRDSLTEGGAAEQELRAAAGLSAEMFFVTWAKRFGRLLVPLGGHDGHGDGEGGQQQGGGGGGGSKKDDR